MQAVAEDVELANEIEAETAAAAAARRPAEAPETVQLPADGAWRVVREKRFPMPPITVEEAIVCLDYVDHSFYVRRKPGNRMEMECTRRERY